MIALFCGSCLCDMWRLCRSFGFFFCLFFSIWTNWINWKLTDLKIKADHWHSGQSWPSNKQPGTGSYKLLGSFKTMQLDQTEQSMPFFEPAAVMVGKSSTTESNPTDLKAETPSPTWKNFVQRRWCCCWAPHLQTAGKGSAAGQCFQTSAGTYLGNSNTSEHVLQQTYASTGNKQGFHSP